MAALALISTKNIKSRSPAAAAFFNQSSRFEAKSRGVDSHSERVLSKELVDWSDKVFVMESRHREKVWDLNPNAHVINLNISNDYCRNDPALETLLRQKLGYFLE